MIGRWSMSSSAWAAAALVAGLALGVTLASGDDEEERPPPFSAGSTVDEDLAELEAPVRERVRAEVKGAFGEPKAPKVPGGGEAFAPELLARGRAAYGTRRCADCHGPMGFADGPKAALVKPRPRDFSSSAFRYRSTRFGHPPMRSDLERFLERPHFAEAVPDAPERAALAAWVSWLSMRGWATKLLALLGSEDDLEDELLVATDVEFVVEMWRDAKSEVIAAEPPIYPDAGARRAAALRGRASFNSNEKGNCRSCHGTDGRARDIADDSARIDAWGRTIEIRDLATMPLGGGDRPIDLYWRISGGLYGTKMVGTIGYLEPSENWDLVAFLEALRADPEAFERPDAPETAPKDAPDPAPEDTFAELLRGPFAPFGPFDLTKLPDADRAAVLARATKALGDLDAPRLPAKGVPSLDPALIARGREAYAAGSCADCHGSEGFGNGYKAAIVKPRPRDFTSGAFRYRSTAIGGRPVPADIDRFLSRPHFAEAVADAEERAALGAFVAWLAMRGETLRGLARSAFEDEELDPDVADDVVADVAEIWTRAADGVVTAEPPTYASDGERAAAAARGRALFHDAAKGSCQGCHGTDGAATDVSNEKAWVDEWGRPVEVRAIATMPLGGGEEPLELYRRIAIGLSGTSMPGYGRGLEPAEIWDLVAYIQALRAGAKKDGR